MSTAVPEIPEAHVVHRLQHPHDGAAPRDLRLRPSSSPSKKAWLRALAVAVAVICAAVAAILWIFATPNGWHIPINLFWSIVLGLIAIAGGVGAHEYSSNSSQRSAATARWDATSAHVVSVPALVVARDAGTSDEGDVVRIELTVESEDGARFRGKWRARGGTPRVLQTQIPGIGSAATVWRISDGVAEDPIVIEVVDPTVIQHGKSAGTRIYIE